MKYYKWTVKTFSETKTFLPLKVNGTDHKELALNALDFK